MRINRFLAKVLDIGKSWRVKAVETSVSTRTVVINLEMKAGAKMKCPTCKRQCSRYDKRWREWRHLDLFRFKTILTAEVPRVKCPDHGVTQLRVPWAEAGCQFTALFEALVLTWLKEASINAVARQMGISWTAVSNIMKRGVARGKSRRKKLDLRRICVDETAFRKGHNYVTVVTDHDTGCVVYVGEDRKTDSLDGFYQELTSEQLAGIECVSMDMWPPYIKATREHVPDADEKIAFDRFHVAQMMSKAVNLVRRDENRELVKQGNNIMVGTRYSWLRDPGNMSRRQQLEFSALRRSDLRTARAWAMKEMSGRLWRYVHRTWAAKAWKRLIQWMARSRLDPMKAVAKTLRKHLWGIINAIILSANNSMAESVNSRIKMVKVRARGFRNKESFRDAILFHHGGLDVLPDGVQL